MRILKLKGLIAAAFTPFTENGEMNYGMIPKMADSLSADGITGVYVCGSTGEGISCSVEERIQLMEAWSKAAKGRLTLIAHTGALSLKDISVLNRKAVELEYDAFSVIPPTFFKPGNVRELTDYCRAAAESAPELPFYYYHTMKSGVEIPMRDFLEYADGRIPNLAGVKFNHHNLHDFQNPVCRIDFIQSRNKTGIFSIFYQFCNTLVNHCSFLPAADPAFLFLILILLGWINFFLFTLSTNI